MKFVGGLVVGLALGAGVFWISSLVLGFVFSFGTGIISNGFLSNYNEEVFMNLVGFLIFILSGAAGVAVTIGIVSIAD